MTVRQYAREVKRLIVSLKGLNEAQAKGIRVTDADAQWDMSDGLTPMESAKAWVRGYNPNGAAWKEAGTLVGVAMEQF